VHVSRIRQNDLSLRSGVFGAGTADGGRRCCLPAASFPLVSYEVYFPANWLPNLGPSFRRVPMCGSGRGIVRIRPAGQDLRCRLTGTETTHGRPSDRRIPRRDCTVTIAPQKFRPQVAAAVGCWSRSIWVFVCPALLTATLRHCARTVCVDRFKRIMVLDLRRRRVRILVSLPSWAVICASWLVW